METMVSAVEGCVSVLCGMGVTGLFSLNYSRSTTGAISRGMFFRGILFFLGSITSICREAILRSRKSAVGRRNTGVTVNFFTAGELTDFAATAGLIANLDLMISVVTSTAHLAAAMGKPSWRLNRYDT
jgi:hypothetical protein